MEDINGDGFVIKKGKEERLNEYGYPIKTKYTFVEGDKYIAKKNFGYLLSKPTDFHTYKGDVLIYKASTYWGEPHFIVEKTGKDVSVDHQEIDDHIETIQERRKRRIKGILE